jgi:hypothetical protein
MSDSKMSKTNQTKGVERQVVTSLGENPTLQITTVKSDGLNYLAWSQSAVLSAKSRGNMGYLNGRIQEPQLNDPDYDKWEQKIPQLCHAYYIQCNQKSVNGTYSSIQPKKFGMLLLRHFQSGECRTEV